MTVEISKRADREIPEPQIGEAALLPQPEQRPVEGKTQRIIAALDRNADALAEIAALGEGSADEDAAVRRVGAVEPERERDAVAEKKIGLALAQPFACRLRVAVGLQLRLGEERLQIRLVRGAADHRDLLALDSFRDDVAQRR